MTLSNPFAEAQKASVDVLFGLGSKAFDGGQQLIELNLQAIKASLADLSESAQSVLSVKSPQEFVSLQSAGLKSAAEKAASYGRHVQQIVTESAASQRDSLQAQLAELQKTFAGAFEGALQNVQGGGAEQAMALMKSSMAAASKAYENVSQAGRKVTDAVDANIVKMTENTEASVRAAKAKTVS